MELVESLWVLQLPAATELGPYGDVVVRGVGFFVGSLLVYAVGRLLLIPGVIGVVRRRNRNNATIETATETYLHVVVLALAAGAGIVGAGYGGVLTDSALIIAAVTLVVGVAGREVIGALISGLFLVGDPDFNVGDWIRWPGGEGVIEAVDFRVTRVRTPNNETVTVPNTELTTNALTRPYGRDQFRVVERVDVAYGDDVERALMELVATAREDDQVLEEPRPRARLAAFGDSSVGLETEFWVADPMDVDLVTMRSAFRRRVKRRFDEMGLTLGPPSGREVSGHVSVDVVDGERGGEPANDTGEEE